MAKKLLFDLTDTTSTAGFETNAREFYTKALIGDERSKRSTRYFRELLFMGEKVKLGALVPEDVLQDFDCDFNGTDVDLSQKTIESCILSIGVEVCQWDMEQSFLSEYTKNVGAVDFANTSGLMPEFQTHLLNEIARKASENLEKLTWQGKKLASPVGYLDLCDGLIELLTNDADVEKVVSTAPLTSSNIIDKIEALYAIVPEALPTEKVKIGMSTKAFRLYKMAVAKQNNINYITASLANQLLDYEVIEFPGAPSDFMIAGVFDENFIFSTDLSRDAELSIINMKETTGDRKFRVIGDLKFGVDYLVSEEIAIYYHQGS